jgi:hypothetical protein
MENIETLGAVFKPQFTLAKRGGQQKMVAQPTVKDRPITLAARPSARRVRWLPQQNAVPG